jgi:predicted AAA+ superfamily ATPase
MAHLVGDSSEMEQDPRFAGPLLETFVISELRKQIASLSRRRPTIWFLRTHTNVEVDVVLERGGGREVVGIEVKASSSVTGKDMRGLQWLRDQMGDRFVRGVILYTGEHALQFGERLWAMPVDALWRLDASPQEDDDSDQAAKR